MEEDMIVWAKVPGVKVLWPARLEVESENHSHFKVFCHSDDAIINAKKVSSFKDIEERTAEAKHALRKKPETWQTWLSDLDWAKQELDKQNRKATSRSKEVVSEVVHPEQDYKKDWISSGHGEGSSHINSEEALMGLKSSEHGGDSSHIASMDSDEAPKDISSEHGGDSSHIASMDSDEAPKDISSEHGGDSSHIASMDSDEAPKDISSEHGEDSSYIASMDSEETPNDGISAESGKDSSYIASRDSEEAPKDISSEYCEDSGHIASMNTDEALMDGITSEHGEDNSHIASMDSDGAPKDISSEHGEDSSHIASMDSDGALMDGITSKHGEDSSYIASMDSEETPNDGISAESGKDSSYIASRDSEEAPTSPKDISSEHGEDSSHIASMDAEEVPMDGITSEHGENSSHIASMESDPEEDPNQTSSDEDYEHDELSNSHISSSDSDSDEIPYQSFPAIKLKPTSFNEDNQSGESESNRPVSSTNTEEILNQSLTDDLDTQEELNISMCSHDVVGECYIERDEIHLGIFVRKVITSDITQAGKRKSSNRVWNNYHCCFICKKLSTNIIKHLLTHKDHKEIKDLKELRSSTTKESQRLSKTTQALLRNRGDHEHNLNVKKNGKGEMLISRRTVNFHAEEYGPCPYCLEWLKLDSLGSRHQSYCPGTKNDGKVKKAEAIVRSSIITGGINTTATPKLLKEVYPVMTRDEITATAKNDSLVVALGNNWLRRNLGNRLKRKYYTSSRMRGAARLLQHIRTITQSNKSMSDYITPEYFDAMCRAALMCAEMENDDEEDLKSPSSALKISYDVNRMANIKLGLSLRSGEHEKKRESEDFLALLKLEWTTKVSRMARLQLRTNQINQPHKQLPLPEDLSVLGGRVVEELNNLDTHNMDNFRRAQVLVQTRLMTYNKRRSGELEALSLENYQMRSKGLDEADNALLGNDLTDLERYLVDSQELIKIRGKNGKIVPILVPEDSINALAFICSPLSRRSVGIKAWNPYVFANTGDGVIRAYDSLKEICGELNLAAPDRITSVTMRKYIATLSQVIDMKDHELQWLCNHLGHTVEIHKLHYRSTSGFIERVNIGKLMLLQDLNVAGKYAGKRLQDIDLSEVVTNPQRENPGREKPDTDDLVEDEVDHSVSEIVEAIGEDSKPDKGKKNSSSTRLVWSKEEEKELRELLADNLRMKRIPRMRECLKAIGQSRKNKGVLHRRKWETIKKKTLRLINKY